MTGKVEPLDIPYPERQPDQVTTYDVSDLFSPTTSNQSRRYNPDELVRKRGLRIYSQMQMDEQVKAVCEFKSSAILARGIEFCFDKSSALSEEEQDLRKRVFTRVCAAMKGSFDDALEAISSGREYGYSMTEKIYGTVTVDGSPYIGINELALRQPHRFDFIVDDYGTLQGAQQKIGGGKSIEVDMSRMIHYVHRPKWDRIYGRSDLYEAYRAWYAKDQIIKLWLPYLEKFGGGISIAKRTGDEAPKYGTSEFSALQTALNNLGAGRSVILPTGVELDIQFPSTTDGYENAVRFFDLAIAKALLVPNLLGLSHAGQTGSFAQSETQFKAFLWTLSKDKQRLEDTLNDQLWRDLGDQNWGDGEYPRMHFKQATDEHIKWTVDNFVALTNAKALIPTEADENQLRGMLELSMRDAESKPIVDPQAEADRLFNEAMQKQAVTQAQSAQKSQQQYSDITRAIEALSVQLASLKNGDTVTNITLPSAAVVAQPHSHSVDKSDAHPDGKVVAHGKRTFADEERFQVAARRVAFAVIERNVEGSITAATNRMADIIARATSKTLGSDADLGMLVDSDTSDIHTVQFAGADVSKLRASALDVLGQGWKIGSTHAQNELDRARGEPLDPEKVVAKFARLEDKAASYFEDKAFRMAGDTSDQAKKIIQTELQNAVKSGKPLAAVRAAIWNALIRKGLTRDEAVRGIETDDQVNSYLDELLQGTEEGAAAYLQTLVRTNVFEALNEARFQEFTDPALGDFVEAFQYAAVLDSSTTEICSSLNGSVYKADSEFWDEYRPPNHFNAIPQGTPITLDKGIIPIEGVKVGDRVLTHKGRFRQVTEVMRHDSWPEEIKIDFDNGHQFVCTPDHPVLTERGWVCAGDLLMTDSVLSFMRNGKTRYCEGCGEKIQAKGKKKSKRFCSHACMGKAMRRLPAQRCKNCGAEMVSSWKQPIYSGRQFCTQSCYFAYKGETSIERTVREWLAEAHIQAKPQFQFGKYFVDFYLPDFELAIECDGDFWHTVREKPLPKRVARQALLAEFGVSVVRLSQKMIQSGSFKRVLSEVLHAIPKESAHSVVDAAALQEAGL